MIMNLEKKKTSYAYIANRRMPSEMAHSVYVAKTVEATKKLGIKTILLIPKKSQPPDFEYKDFWEYYGIEKELFTLVEFSVPEMKNLPNLLETIVNHLRHQITTWVFAVKSVTYLARKTIKIIQTNDREVIFLLKLHPSYRPTIIYDVHMDPRNAYEQLFEKLILPNVNLVVVNTEFFRRFYRKRGIKNEKIIVLPNGFDPEQYHYSPTSKMEMRKHLNIAPKMFVVGFVGRLETIGLEKGLETLIKAIEVCGKKIPMLLLTVGGPKRLALKYKKLAKKIGLSNRQVKFIDHVKPSVVGKYISAFDVACMLYPDNDHFREKMSPMKAMEYMAAKKPIIASNLPAIRLLLNDQMGYLVKPNDEREVTKTLEKIWTNQKVAGKRAEKAFKFVQQFTWQKRQQRILQQVI